MKKLFTMIDFALLQLLCAVLFIIWLYNLRQDIANHHVLTAANRVNFFTTGFVLAVIMRLSWGRYAIARWVSVILVVTAMLHVCTPADRLTAIAAGICGVAAMVALRIPKWKTLTFPDVTRSANRKHHGAAQATKVSSRMPGESQASRPSEAAYSFDDLIRRSRWSFSDVAGMDEIKQRLLSAGREIINGTGKRNGILLVGEPGVGKTFLVEALAGELDVAFFALSFQDIASPWVNESPLKVKAAFSHAKNLGKPIVFLLDEFDAYVKPRAGTGAHHMDRDLTNTLLTEIVRLRDSRVVLVAATNSLALVDQAAVRQGRFDLRIEIPPPDAAARRMILSGTVNKALGRGQLPAAVLESLVERWEGFSAARLAALGAELADMRHTGLITGGALTFDSMMKAMRRLQGTGVRLPEKVKGLQDIIMPEQSRHELVDLGFRLRHAFELQKLGGALPRGVLLIGPPGTGKTASVLALAAATGVALITVRGCDVLRDPSIWDKALADARDARPAILFVDEIETLIGDRRGSGIAPVTNAILTGIDGTEGRSSDVLFVGATNYPDILDEAALRGGRFDHKIAFDLPDDASMASYVRAQIRLLAGDVFAVSRFVMDSLIGGLRGHSIADADAVMQGVIDAAALRSLREGGATITTCDVQTALRKTLARHWRQA
ncbi:AAA family ATPase [Paraburkholderia hospita]|uniref:AAA family ATPase n=1 Tax=Paraburkholderia hospita TaxID=169430 RepID=UPI000B342478|nr:AAA family ATPase [Paraburkholderia hospita]OUL97151.1 hypothetical protein CA601_00755 [Paraburkholderia hospita]